MTREDTCIHIDIYIHCLKTYISHCVFVSRIEYEMLLRLPLLLLLLEETEHSSFDVQYIHVYYIRSTNVVCLCVCYNIIRFRARRESASKRKKIHSPLLNSSSFFCCSMDFCVLALSVCVCVRVCECVVLDEIKMVFVVVGSRWWRWWC